MLCLAGWMISWPAGATEDLQRVKLAKGQAAPFTGILVTSEALAKVITTLEGEAAKLRVELAAERKAAQVRQEAAVAKLQAELELERAKRLALEGDLARRVRFYEGVLTDRNLDPPWYKSRYLAFVTGAVVSAGVCAAGAVR